MFTQISEYIVSTVFLNSFIILLYFVVEYLLYKYAKISVTKVRNLSFKNHWIINLSFFFIPLMPIFNQVMISETVKKFDLLFYFLFVVFCFVIPEIFNIDWFFVVAGMILSIIVNNITKGSGLYIKADVVYPHTTQGE